jgi:hypothetical protein
MLEKTQTAAKGDIRRLSVELQGMRDEQTALARQAAKMNVSACIFPSVIHLNIPGNQWFWKGLILVGFLRTQSGQLVYPRLRSVFCWSLGGHSVIARVCSGNSVHSFPLNTKDTQKLNCETPSAVGDPVGIHQV